MVCAVSTFQGLKRRARAVGEMVLVWKNLSQDNTLQVLSPRRFQREKTKTKTERNLTTTQYVISVSFLNFSFPSPSFPFQKRGGGRMGCLFRVGGLTCLFDYRSFPITILPTMLILIPVIPIIGVWGTPNGNIIARNIDESISRALL